MNASIDRNKLSNINTKGILIPTTSSITIAWGSSSSNEERESLIAIKPQKVITNKIKNLINKLSKDIKLQRINVARLAIVPGNIGIFPK